MPNGVRVDKEALLDAFARQNRLLELVTGDL